MGHLHSSIVYNVFEEMLILHGICAYYEYKCVLWNIPSIHRGYDTCEKCNEDKLWMVSIHKSLVLQRS